MHAPAGDWQVVTSSEFKAYRSNHLSAIKKLLDGPGGRPVLFLGSGVTRRYLGGPSWLELLEAIAAIAGLTNEQFNFLSQKAGNSPADLGTLLVDPVHEWAWNEGKPLFPESYFGAEINKPLFLKHLAATYLRPFTEKKKKHFHPGEITLLKRTSPHAIITTNFDLFIEQLFPDFELVVGEHVIPMSMNITGEIYKIHGSVTDPSTLVLTRADYDRFLLKRRYISSKMMTYFAEYPVFIIGYSLNDPNVNSIISDLGEALKDKGGLLENVFYVEWVKDVSAVDHLREEYVFPVESGALPPLRVRTIVTTKFDWLLRGLADFASPVPVNTKLLRHLAARVIDLVRTDVPLQEVEIDYEKIENLSDDNDKLAMLLGISKVTNPNISHPYILLQVAEKLGVGYWARLEPLIAKANTKVGFVIKNSDNRYHIGIKSGDSGGIMRKYSEIFVALLKEIQASGS